MKHQPDSSKNGFTLIEIMLALMVITIGIVSITGLLSSSLGTTSKTHNDLNVVTFADLVLNTCHANGFDALETSGSLSIIETDGMYYSLKTGEIDTYTGILPSFENQTQEYTVQYRIQVENLDNAKALFLEVWPTPDTTATPRRFYTEIYDWKKRG